MGPLTGFRILEIPSIGPTQFAGMALGDLGAEVLRLDRATSVAAGSGMIPASPYASLDRNRRSMGIDLKHPRGAETVLTLCESADVLIEGFRPGVAERLGIGPEVALERNPRLVYGRMTGWGQEGPLAHEVGHDINYIALAGVLAHIGTAGGPPVPPINLVGDFGGGGLLLAFGILAALLERGQSGKGQVIDAAMIDGAAMQMSVFVGMSAMGFWSDERGTNLLDGGAHFYGVYGTSDGQWISIASYEPQFYAELVQLLGPLGIPLDPATQMDEFRRHVSTMDVIVGSVHAVTEDGHVVVASASGSQIAAYAFGAGRVIWVVGAQKVVTDLDDAFARIEQHSLPLEDRRLQAAYGMPSYIGKQLVISRDQPGRSTMLLLEDAVGF